MKNTLIALGAILLLASCTKEQQTNSSTAKLVFKFKFDSTQVRLNNVGQPAVIPNGNACQSPRFNSMSSHYIELTPTGLTPLGKGAVIYKAPETTAGGTNAIDFEKSALAGNNETFYAAPISQITPGSYEWLRVSLAYQNYDITYHVDTTNTHFSYKADWTGTIASFIGFNTYIKTLTVKTQSVDVNANKKQGFWAFESHPELNLKLPVATGQAPEGSTTVVNPIFATSPIPQGSCVVTAHILPGKLVITGKETQDIVVEVSLSTNKSFEWKEVVKDGKWEPLKKEQVVDMGIRGMIATIK